MDPVDRTFDTIYGWTQAASRVTNQSVSYVKDTATSVSRGVSSGVYGLFNSYIGSPTTTQTPDPLELSIHSWYPNSIVGLKRFAHDHKFITSSVAVVLGLSSGWYVYNKATRKIRRKAQRLPNGARKDVVLIVGSVSEPLTRFIAHDLETRGFIVYITSTNTKADMKYFANESAEDVKSLIVSPDFKSNDFNTEQIAKLDYILSSEHIPFQGAQPNKLNLVGMIFIPDLYFPTGKFHSIPPRIWDQNVEAKMLLPLNLLNNGLIGIAQKYDTNVIFITPTLSSNLHLPYHSVENMTSSFLSSLCANLVNDYEDLNITNLKLGSISICSNNNKKTFGIWGETMRKLHHKIFDLVYSEHVAGVQYCGTGARILNWWGKWIPRWLLRLAQLDFKKYITN